MSSYLYENWRGKVFLIDERFAEELRKSLRQDPETDQSIIDAMTPERIFTDLPMYEEERRYEQLEEMWEQPPADNDR